MPYTGLNGKSSQCQLYFVISYKVHFKNFFQRILNSVDYRWFFRVPYHQILQNLQPATGASNFFFVDLLFFSVTLFPENINYTLFVDSLNLLSYRHFIKQTENKNIRPFHRSLPFNDLQRHIKLAANKKYAKKNRSWVLTLCIKLPDYRFN